jgi:UDP-glucose 4-epimerase
VIRDLDKAVKKIVCEHVVHAYAKFYSFKAVAMRYASVVGPRLRHGVVWDFTNKLLRNSTEPEIPGDGKQVWRYIYIEDAVEATIVA